MSSAAFVLIVEDEVAHGEAIAEALESARYACHLVHSGEAAVESIRQRPPDVVVTDYKLGGKINGLDVLRESKRVSPNTEVILITAYGSESLAREALSRDNDASAAYDYLIKPIDIDILLYGQLTLDDERLTIPHPRLHERRFVLAPLSEIAGDMTPPALGLSIQELARKLEVNGPGNRVVRLPDQLLLHRPNATAAKS